MKHKKEWFIAFIGIVSGIITIVVWVKDTSLFWKGVTVSCVFFSVIIWFRQFYLDTKLFIREKEEEFRKTMSELNEAMKRLEESTIGFCDTCDRTRWEVHGYHNDVISKLEMPSRVEYDMEKVKGQLQHVIDKVPPNSIMKIICYGRKGYGYIVQYIAEKKKSIELEIVLCKTGKSELAQDDSDMITGQIQYMLNNRFKVYASEIPPAIRAAVVYTLTGDGEKEPVWCSFQSYKLGYNEKNHMTLQCPEHYPIHVENENGDSNNLKKLVDVFEAEYDFLQKYCTEAYLSEEGSISYKSK